MSDYISNLVVRSLGWANTVQPRWRSLFEPPAQSVGGTAWSPSQPEEIVSVESLPSSRGLDKQKSKGRENKVQSNRMPEQPLDSQPLSSSSPAPNPANLAPTNSREPRDITVLESQPLSPKLLPPLPFQAEEEKDVGEVLTKVRQSDPPLGQQSTQSESLSFAQGSNLAPASSTGDRELESVEERRTVELEVSPWPKSMPPTDQNTEVTVTENQGRELTSNWTQPESTQPSPQPAPMPAQASEVEVAGEKSVKFWEIEKWETEPNSEVAAQPARPVPQVVRSQATSPVAKAQLTSDSREEKTPIRVTIGRIEVQALPPPEELSPPSQPFTPRLSLEAYLKSRQEGRK